MDPRLVALEVALRRGRAGIRQPDRTLQGWNDGYRPAAVAAVLRYSKQVELLLIRRAENERDPWSGQIALPGGKHDPTDASLVATAIRETREETGLDLSHPEAREIGSLEVVTPSSRALPLIRISPFVFGVGSNVEAVTSPEVAEVFWVPLSRLRDPGSADVHTLRNGQVAQHFPSYKFEDQKVWGLTHRIVSDLLEVSPEESE